MNGRFELMATVSSRHRVQTHGGEQELRTVSFFIGNTVYRKYEERGQACNWVQGEAFERYVRKEVAQLEACDTVEDMKKFISNFLLK